MESKNKPNAQGILNTTSNQAQYGVLGLLKRIPLLFGIVVVLPVIVAAIYFTLIASDVYVSESRFVVRNPTRSSGGSSALAQMMGGSSYSSASADSYPVIDYMQSRDAAAELDKNNYLRRSYGENGDWISKYHRGWKDNDESLWRYYKRHIVDVDMDDETSIIVLKTRAYHPNQAQQINGKLLGMGERLINQMNARAMHDAVDAAQTQVEVAEQRVKSAATNLATYREGNGVYNPEQQSVVQFQQAAQLQARLFAAQSQLDQLKQIAPNSPQLTTVNANIRALKSQVAASNEGIIGGNESLSKKGPRYTEAALDLEFSSQQLGMALTTLESARATALRKQLYLEEIIQPNYPAEAIEPYRIRSIFTALIASLLLWAILSLLISSVREHRD